METEHETLKAGVANFRGFQSEMRDFTVDFKARDDERKNLLISQQQSVKDSLYAQTQHQSERSNAQNFKLNLLMLIVIAIGTAGALLSYVVMFRR